MNEATSCMIYRKRFLVCLWLYHFYQGRLEFVNQFWKKEKMNFILYLLSLNLAWNDESFFMSSGGCFSFLFLMMCWWDILWLSFLDSLSCGFAIECNSARWEISLSVVCYIKACRCWSSRFNSANYMYTFCGLFLDLLFDLYMSYFWFYMFSDF